MRQLIWKDIMIQRRTAYVSLFMGFLFFFYFRAMDQKSMLAAIIPIFVIVYSFINRSMLEDERNHTIRMLLCLPVQRKLIVKAKYASVALVALASTVIFTLTSAAFGLFSFASREERLLNLFIIAATMLSYTLIIAVFIPLVYKVGIVKAQTINRFFFIGLMILGVGFSGLVKILKDRFSFFGNPPGWVNWLNTHIERLNPYAGLIFLFSLSVLIFVCSMLLAVRFFNRREAF